MRVLRRYLAGYVRVQGFKFCLFVSISLNVKLKKFMCFKHVFSQSLSLSIAGEEKTLVGVEKSLRGLKEFSPGMEKQFRLDRAPTRRR